MQIKNDIGGRVILVGAMMPPEVRLLSDGARTIYDARCKVVGCDKARAYQFGALCDYVFPCNWAMLNYLLERAHADGLPFPDELAAVASAIALGKPIGNGRDYFEGGEAVTNPTPAPRKPRGGGATVGSVPAATARAIAALQSEASA